MKLNRDDFGEIVRKTPLVSIDLIIRNEKDELLLDLRTNEPAKNFWFVPGGRIFKNERLTEALSRVARNELGVDLALQHFAWTVYPQTLAR